MKPKQRQGCEDGADSQNKARMSDTWITLDFDEESSTMSFFVAKCRYGKRGGSVELPADLACARIASRGGYEYEQERF